MPVRTAYAGAAVSGEVLTAANVNKIPGGWIGYAEVTANQGSIAGTEVDLTGLTVTITAGASRRLKITGGINLTSNTGGDRVTLFIKEGATVLNARPLVLATSNLTEHIEFCTVVTPTTGAHTYKLSLQRADGTGTITMGAAAIQPAFILVEDLGPAA